MSVDEAIESAKAKQGALIAPIDGGVGEDLSYDEAFEAVKAEIDKQNQIDGGAIDWKNVCDLCVDLLSNRTKDFRLALYYAMGRTQTDGFVGLFEGLVVLSELCTAFWEPMFPPLRRPRARGNLLAWFNEVTTPIVHAASPTPQQRDVVEALAKVFAELDSSLAEKLGEAYPPMMTLSDACRGLVRRAPAAPVAAPEPPPPSASTDQPASSAAEPAADSLGATPADGAPQAGGAVMAAVAIVDAESAYAALQQVAPILGQASGALFNIDAASVDAYRLGMQAAFLLIGSDPYNENGQTSVQGPLDQVRQDLAGLASGGDWQGLVNSGWAAMQEQPFWLDASRALAQGLRGLGPPHDAAAVVVEREVAALLARAPALPSLTFADGTPLADADTQAWISGLGASGGGGGAPRSPVDKAAADANKVAAEGNLAQAMTILSRAAQTTSPVDRFRARLEIAKLALAQQFFDMARAHLDALERSADEHRLAAWDPALCAELYANLYRVRRAIAQNTMDDPEIGKKAAQSFERLCELDAARAFTVMSEG